MTTTPHSIVSATCAVIAAAALPLPVVPKPWRMLPFADADLPAIAVLASSYSEAPAAETMGPSAWKRTQTLSIVIALDSAATDEGAGDTAVAEQEAVLDALFASETWCAQWERTPSVDVAMDMDRTSDGRRVMVGITIRGEYSVTRAYASPAETCQTIRYENNETGGGEYHGQTLA